MKYQIIDFDPHVLEGKMRVDSEQTDSIKPVSLIVDISICYHSCGWIDWRYLARTVFLQEVDLNINVKIQMFVLYLKLGLYNF